MALAVNGENWTRVTTPPPNALPLPPIKGAQRRLRSRRQPRRASAPPPQSDVCLRVADRRHRRRSSGEAVKQRAISRAYSQASRSTRGLPIRTGWNSTAAASVVSSDSASSLPMLDVPGWLESHRLPNAVAVVSAL